MKDRDGELASRPLDGSVTCPFCASADVKLELAFGGSVSDMLFRCQACRSFFHWIKWRPEPTEDESRI
jgi:transposase-like protein